MIETIKDSDNKVVAFIEWTLVDKDGKICNDGVYVFVNELWVHESLRNGNVIRNFIQLIASKTPQCEYGYWERRKYNCRLKMFKLEQLLKKE